MTNIIISLACQPTYKITYFKNQLKRVAVWEPFMGILFCVNLCFLCASNNTLTELPGAVLSKSTISSRFSSDCAFIIYQMQLCIW